LIGASLHVEKGLGIVVKTNNQRIVLNCFTRITLVKKT